MDVLLCEPCNFPEKVLAGTFHGTLKVFIEEILWSIWESEVPSQVLNDILDHDLTHRILTTSWLLIRTRLSTGLYSLNQIYEFYSS